MGATMARMKQPSQQNTSELPTLIGTLGFSRRRAASACGIEYHSLLRCLAAGRTDLREGRSTWQADLVERIDACDTEEARAALSRARDLSTGKDPRFIERYISRRWSDCLTSEAPDAPSELGDSSEPFDFVMSREDLGDNESLADSLASPDDYRSALIRLHQRCGRRMRVPLASIRFGDVSSGYCTEQGDPIARRLASHFGWSVTLAPSASSAAHVPGGYDDAE
jgi:hypothetical protein